MSFGTIIAVYFVIWWITFVAMVNYGHTSQAKAGTIEKGTPAGAPQNFSFGRKAFWVSIVAAIVTAFIYWLIEKSGLSLSDYPFMPNFREYK